MSSLALPTIQPSQSHTPSPSAPAPSAPQPTASQRTRKRSTPPLEEDSDEEEEEDKRRGTGPSKKKASGVWGWEDMGDYKYMVEIRQMVSAGLRLILSYTKCLLFIRCLYLEKSRLHYQKL